MNKNNIEAGQPGQQLNNEPKADEKHVSPSIANANVVGSLFKSREIKFKYIFQHEETGRMCSIIFDYSQIFNGECKAQCERLTGYFIVSKNQYTGLNDKNGKEIYEGDIVSSFKKPYEDALSINKVEFKKGGWSLVCKGKNDIPLFLYNPEHLKVTGNIFENPELLQALR